MGIGAGVTHTANEDWVRKAREATSKAEAATYPEAKRAWEQIAKRWLRVGEETERANRRDAAPFR
jgi:hypothetical protein